MVVTGSTELALRASCTRSAAVVSAGFVVGCGAGAAGDTSQLWVWQAGRQAGYSLDWSLYLQLQALFEPWPEPAGIVC